MIEITLTPFLAKLVLQFTPFSRLKVMCLGCGEDFEQFTELVWGDDKYLGFYGKESYPKFQLWYV